MAPNLGFIHLSSDNPKVEVGDAGIFGLGVIAIADIGAGEEIADWAGGKVYHAKRASDLPNDAPDLIRNHAIQFAQDKYIDTVGIGRRLNHSCEPNCGFRGKFLLVAMRNIKKGEWLTFDYEMSEDSDWRMECKCGSRYCRKVVGAFANMPKGIREKYKGFISDWLVEKYCLDE